MTSTVHTTNPQPRSFTDFFKARLKLDFYSWSFFRNLVLYKKRKDIVEEYTNSNTEINHRQKMALDLLAGEVFTSIPIIPRRTIFNLNGVLSSLFGLTPLLKAPFDYCSYRREKLDDSASRLNRVTWGIGILLSAPFKLVSMVLSPVDTFYSIYGKLTNYGMPRTAEEAVILIESNNDETDTLLNGSSSLKACTGLSNIISHAGHTDNDLNSDIDVTFSSRSSASSNEVTHTPEDLTRHPSIGPFSMFKTIRVHYETSTSGNESDITSIKP